MITIEDKKILFCHLIGVGLPIQSALIQVAKTVHNQGTKDGYPDAPFNANSKKMVIKFFIDKTLETKSLDEGFLKAMWRAYEHKYEDD